MKIYDLITLNNSRAKFINSRVNLVNELILSENLFLCEFI